MTGETTAAVEHRLHTVDSDAETRIQQGTPAFRRTALALFLAGFSTFGLLYTVQPLLPEFSRHFGVSAAGSAMSLSLTTGTLAVAMLLAGLLSDAVRYQAGDQHHHRQQAGAERKRQGAVGGGHAEVAAELGQQRLHGVQQAEGGEAGQEQRHRGAPERGRALFDVGCGGRGGGRGAWGDAALEGGRGIAVHRIGRAGGGGRGVGMGSG